MMEVVHMQPATPPPVPVSLIEKHRRRNEVVKPALISTTPAFHRTIAIERVVGCVKAMEGDVWGEYVHRHVARRAVVDLDHIECRVEPRLAVGLIKVLAMDYALEQRPPRFGGDHGSMCYSVTSKHGPDVFPPFLLHVSTASRNAWSRGVSGYPIAFDVDILAENSDKNFLRGTHASLLPVPDRLGYIKSRIASKRFCALAFMGRYPTGSIATNVAASMNKAVYLVNAGWTMDDTLLRRKSWVVARWRDVVSNPSSIRTLDDAAALANMKSADTCALCLQRFRKSDVVVNTSCNHNFHFVCDDGQGLQTWLEGQHANCPICRACVTGNV
jgi:hypothetical protein